MILYFSNSLLRVIVRLPRSLSLAGTLPISTPIIVWVLQTLRDIVELAQQITYLTNQMNTDRNFSRWRVLTDTKCTSKIVELAQQFTYPAKPTLKCKVDNAVSQMVIDRNFRRWIAADGSLKVAHFREYNLAPPSISIDNQWWAVTS